MDSALKLLHDINTVYQTLPASYWIEGVSIKRVIDAGGEAIISRGLYQSREVAVRQHQSKTPMDVSVKAQPAIPKSNPVVDRESEGKLSHIVNCVIPMCWG